MEMAPSWYRNRSILFFVGAMVVGCALCYWKITNSRKNEIDGRLEQAVKNIEITLLHAAHASALAMPLMDQPCNDLVLTELRKIVATVPDVRSVNIASNNVVYCTSIFGGHNAAIKIGDYTEGKLLLAGGSENFPTRTMMVLRGKVLCGDFILVGIDGYYLYHILQLLEGEAPLYLKVGDQFMSSTGKVLKISNFSNETELRSKRYPFSVVVDTSALTIWHTIYHHAAGFTLLYIMVVFLMTFFFNRFLRYLHTVEFQLQYAIRHRQIVPWIQPVVESATGRIVGGEVLLRWKHPKYGFISPETFIAVAEQNGEITSLTRACFEQVSADIRAQKQTKALMLCFNVSAKQFQDEQLVELCSTFLSRVPTDSYSLVLEITERENIENSALAIQTATKLKKAGVRLALDDFGTGNANYQFIQKFSPNFLKIDKVFTRGIVHDSMCQTVVESIVSLAEKTGCQVIAEGIEEPTQQRVLERMGVGYLQGYFFSHPMPLNDFLRIVPTAEDN